MRKILSYLFILACAFSASAQTLDLNQPLPVDTSVRKGILPNGMTYYIKSTGVIKDAASYYIIQNVGSILENDDQQGLAHFLEHMAFNGSKNFPGKGILNTLEKNGAVFGKDINAYTSFDETVYNLNNIPTKDNLVETCLTVLQDWSHYLSLTDEEIDAERGVIKEEWRTRQNGWMRLYQTSLPITFNYSKYASRLPIGLIPIVESFDYKTLRDFYHDWYRTDLQAIAIIGDVNVDAIEQKIKTFFSKIPAVENPRERFIVAIPENTDLLFSLGMDPEIATASIEFGIRHKKSLEPENVADLKRSLLETMAIQMLASRISDEAQKPETPFLGARVGYGSLTLTSNNFSLNISPKPEKQQESFTAALTEVVRAVKFGYTQSEIDRTIAQFSNYYETQISKKDDKSHEAIIVSIKDNYLENKTITDIEGEYALVKQLFANITEEDLHNTIKRLYAQNNRFLNVTGVEGHNNLTKEEGIEIINAVENNAQITAYTEAINDKSLISDITINDGTIKKIKNNNALGSKTYTLSNGVVVHYKFVDKQKNNVALKAISYGGESLLKDEDLPSANLLGNLIQMSGLGDYSATELPKVLAGKTAQAYTQLNEITENIVGSSTIKDVETMLQLVHLSFVKPRFDEQAFEVLKNSINNYLVRRSKDIGEQMSDSITTTLYGKNNPRKRIFNQEYADVISFERMKTIYLERFANAADFEFFIIGDVPSEQLEPLLAKYIASIPTSKNKETFKDTKTEWISNKIDKDIHVAMEDPKTAVNISIKKSTDFSIKNKIAIQALGDIMQLRLTETLRENEGGVYSPSAMGYLIKEPKTLSFLSIDFDCNPDLAEKLIAIVHTELFKIANGDFNPIDLDKTLTNFLKEREQDKSQNAFSMNLLTTFYRDGYNINDAENFENIVNKISKKNIQTLAKELLMNGKSFEIVFKPKQ